MSNLIPIKGDPSKCQHHVPQTPADYYTKQQIDGLLTTKAGMSDLQDETERAVEAEQSLLLQIDAEHDRAVAKETELEEAIQDESERAISREDDIEEALEDEIERSTDKDTELANALADEVARATTKELLLQSAINDERERALSVETILAAQIESERNRATDVEGALADAIDDVNESIEVLGGDIEDLNEDIENEVSRATTAEGNLLSSIVAEVNRANTAEGNIRTDLNSHISDNVKHITAQERSAWNSKQGALTPGENIQIENGVISATDTTYTAGTGISISSDNVISNTQTSAEWGKITGDIGDQTDLMNQLAILDDSIDDVADDLSDHMLDTTSHVTAQEKSTWDSKADGNHTHDDRYYTESEIDSKLSNKQNTLTPGDNITIVDDVISAEDRLFECTYGVTTKIQVEDALDEGKIPYVNYNGSIYWFAGSAGNYYYFVFTRRNISYYLQLMATNNVWSNASMTLEQSANKKTTIEGNESSNDYYPTTKAVADYVSSHSGGDVDDVKVNGVSVVDSNKVANINKATASSVGVVRASSWTGLAIDSDSGDIYVNGATEADIRQGTQGFKAITPLHAAYTVKYHESLSDVQINGTSIVDENKVADIPTARINRLGLMQTGGSELGIGINSAGLISITKAETSHIDSRNNNPRPITPQNIDYAVKSALTDGKGPAYTETEQEAARDRIGAIGEDLAKDKLFTVNTITESIIKKNTLDNEYKFNVDMIGGQSAVIDGTIINQAVQSISIKPHNLVVNNIFANNMDNWSTENGTCTVSDNVCTYTASSSQPGNFTGISQTNFSLGASHQIYYHCDVYPPTASIRIFNYNAQGTQTNSFNTPLTINTWNTIDKINTTADSVTKRIRFGAAGDSGNVPSGGVCKYRNILVVDLTEVYGAGHEPTLDQCKEIYKDNFSVNTVLKTVNVPSSIKNLDGYGVGIGDKYNYVDFVNKKYHKVITSIDMGSLTWSYSADYFSVPMFYALVNSNLNNKDFVTEYPHTELTPTVPTANGQISKIINNGYVYVCNTSYSNVNDFKAYVTGKHILYESVSEQIIDITDIIDEIRVDKNSIINYITNNDVDVKIPTTISHYVRATNPAPFIAIYGSTTAGEVEKALNEGRQVFLQDGDYLTTEFYIDGTNYYKWLRPDTTANIVSSLRISNSSWTHNYTYFVNKSQGTGNANKVMTVGSDGNVAPMDLTLPNPTTTQRGGVVNPAGDQFGYHVDANGQINGISNGYGHYQSVSGTYIMSKGTLENVFRNRFPYVATYNVTTSTEIENALATAPGAIAVKDMQIYTYVGGVNGQHIFERREQNAIKRIKCAISNNMWTSETVPINDFLVVTEAEYDSMTTHEGMYFVY